MRVHISANVEVFTGGRHRSCGLCITHGDDDESTCTQTHKHTDRMTNLIFSSNVHFVPLVEITRQTTLGLLVLGWAGV